LDTFATFKQKVQMRQIICKSTLLVFLLAFSVTRMTAQKAEVGVLLGLGYYYGDIVNDFDPNTFGPGGGIFIRYHLNDRFALKAFGGYARIGGADSNSASDFQRNRNLSFWSDIYEGSLQLELNLISDRNSGRRIRNPFIPYIFVGVGGFYFNSKAYFPGTNEEVKLYTFQNEGKPYDPYAVCVPFGMGFRYYLTRNLQLGAELGIRYTSTSYIDDVGGVTAVYPNPSQLKYADSWVMYDRSKFPRNPDTGYGYGYPGKQRGKIAINDLYVIGGLTLSYRIGGSGGGGYGGGRAIRCPRFY
jgi:hypothetical protein